MVLTTRCFILCRVVNNSDQTTTEISEKHLGSTWKTTVYHEATTIIVDLDLALPETYSPQLIEIKVHFCFIRSDGAVVHKQDDLHFFRCVAVRRSIHLGRKFIELTEPDSRTTLEFHIVLTGDFLITEQIRITHDFSQLDPRISDIVLVAGGKKFHVNRAILSLQSPYFYDLLEDETELELNSIHPKTLQDILQILYHVPGINEHNVRNLLRWAEKFEMSVVTEQCKRFLRTTDTVPVEERRWLAYYYDLEDLRVGPCEKRGFTTDSEFSDVILVVQDNAFHILATASTYFHSMFFSGFRESKLSKIELKDIDPEAFQSLLEVIYHCPDVNENNVEDLLELSRMYDVQQGIVLSEYFLLTERKLEKEEKSRLAEEYSLVKLKEALKNSATKQDITAPFAKKMKMDL